MWTLGQGLNEEVLRTHLAKYSIEVELNTELVGFEQNTDGVTARLVHHSANEDKAGMVMVDWLVGAEGAKSESRNPFSSS